MTTFADGLYQYGGTPVASAGLPFPATGNAFFVNPVSGSDGNSGKTPSEAFSTLYKAHAMCTAGNNDVVFLIGNGGTTATARLSTALAQTITPAATVGTLLWTKNATHLIGITAPTMFAQRARIAPPSGTYTVTTFGSAAFVTNSAVGCYFSNFSLFNGFSTGGAAQICWTDTGGRNMYNNVAFGGLGDAGSAQDTGSRSLKISGTTGENTFVGCSIGLDTVTRTVANGSLEFAGATPRNVFKNCYFTMQTSASTPFHIIGTGNECMDRFALFDRCTFGNNVDATSTAITAVASFTTASPGGSLVFANCNSFGATKWGDTNALANSYVSGVGGAATDGLMLNPT